MKSGDKVTYIGGLARLAGKSGAIESVGSSIVWVRFTDNSIYGVRPENLEHVPTRFKAWAIQHTEALTAIGIALCIMAVWAAVIATIYFR